MVLAIFFRYSRYQIILPVRQVKAAIKPFAFLTVVETDANDRHIVIANCIGNFKRGPAKLCYRASSAAILIFDSKPIGSAGFKRILVVTSGRAA